MKQYTITKGYNALARMAGSIMLPIKKAYEIHVLMKAIEPVFSARIETEKKLMRDLNGRFEKDGSIVFDSEEHASAYREALIELNNIDTDVSFTPVALNFSDLEGQKIMPSDIGALDGFIQFN